MFKNSIDNKKVINKNGIEIVDFISRIFNDKKIGDGVFNLYRVPESMKMRIDLVSLAAYGTDEYADILLKYNGISNPFTLNTDDILLVPTLDTIADDLIPLQSANNVADKIRNYHKYIDKSKAPSIVGSQPTNMKIDKNGKAYWWYLDNAKNMAIEIDTGKIIEDANEIDNLFFKGV